MPPNRGRWPSNRGKSSRGRPAAPRGRMRQTFFPTNPTMGAAAEGFSMRDEARNTASHQSTLAWTAGDAKLRQKPVAFVSAGLAEPLKETKSDDDAFDPKVVDEESAGDAVAAFPVMEDADGETTAVIAVVETEESIETVAQVASANEHSAAEEHPDGVEQQADDGDGEAKELFFFDLGDGEPPLQTSLPPPQIPSPRSSISGSDSSEEVILFRGRTANVRGAAEQNEASRSIPSVGPSTQAPVRGFETSAAILNRPDLSRPTPSSEPFQKRSKPQRKRSRAPKAEVNDDEDDEDAILADYISNMAANPDDDFLAGRLQGLSTHRDLGGDDGAVNFGSGDEKSPRGDDLLDADSTESLGSGVSDAENEDSENGSDAQDMDADMDDETLARLLAKQEELGLGGDELLLFTSSTVRATSQTRRGNRSVKAVSSQAVRGRASASQVADAFDSLDLADWGHLTGQTRKRRSKQPPNFDVSDSEIEATLRASWQRDRERKKNRKQEREARRAEGLLDKNADPSDLRVKYPSGMKLDDMKAELTSFLLGSSERLDFPPLDKHARKVLHELANKFNVKSQSTGKGDQRRPVLYRTKRTVQYAATRTQDAASHVEQASLRIHRKYFHRVDVKVQRTESPRTGGGGGRSGGHKALTIREGEIVGASVPELGQENKGRTMLEKMGWSKGMALGSLDNKGILEPVAQVMKRSKAGLG